MVFSQFIIKKAEFYIRNALRENSKCPWKTLGKLRDLISEKFGHLEDVKCQKGGFSACSERYSILQITYEGYLREKIVG